MKASPVFLGCWVLLFGAAFLYLTGRQLRQDALFDGSVERDTVKIKHLWTTGKHGNAHRASFSFIRGDHPDGWTTIAPSTYAVVNTGQQVPVKFLPGHPETARVDWPMEEQWQWHNDKISFGLGVFVVCMGLCVVYFNWRK